MGTLSTSNKPSEYKEWQQLPRTQNPTRELDLRSNPPSGEDWKRLYDKILAPGPSSKERGNLRASSSHQDREITSREDSFADSSTGLTEKATHKAFAPRKLTGPIVLGFQCVFGYQFQNNWSPYQWPTMASYRSLQNRCLDGVNDRLYLEVDLNSHSTMEIGRSRNKAVEPGTYLVEAQVPSYSAVARSCYVETEAQPSLWIDGVKKHSLTSVKAKGTRNQYKYYYTYCHRHCWICGTHCHTRWEWRYYCPYNTVVRSIWHRNLQSCVNVPESGSDQVNVRLTLYTKTSSYQGGGKAYLERPVLSPCSLGASLIPSYFPEGSSTETLLSVNPSSGCSSVSALSFDWNNDGGYESSSARHTYTEKGVHTVNVRANLAVAGASCPIYDSVTFEVINVPPTVEIAGGVPPSPIPPGTTITLEVRVSDTGPSDVLELTLDFLGDGSDPIVVGGLENCAPCAVSRSFTYPTYPNVGTYSISVAASDGTESSTTSRTVSVECPPFNLLPTLLADSIEGSLVSLLILNFLPFVVEEVDWGDGTVNQELTHTYADEGTGEDTGTYTVTVQATHAATGCPAQDSASITIHNVAPTFVVGGVTDSITIDLGTSLDLTIACQDPGLFDTISASFAFESGGVATNDLIQDPTNAVPCPNDPTATTVVSFDFQSLGTFNGRVLVSDNDGGEATTMFDVVVVCPISTFITSVPMDSTEGTPVSVTVDASYSDVQVDWDGDDVFEGTTTTHTFEDNGSYSITFKAVDAFGCSQRESVSLEVANVAPSLESLTIDGLAVFPVPAVPALVTAKTEDDVIFALSCSDPGLGDLVSLHVDFDMDDDDSPVYIVASDLNPSSTETCVGSIVHQYYALGTFEGKVTVRDDDGGFSEETFSVEVVCPDLILGASVNEGTFLEGTDEVAVSKNDGFNLQTIDWGDGIVTDGSETGHIFADDGDFSITVSAFSTTYPSCTVTESLEVTVWNVPPAIDTVSGLPEEPVSLESATVAPSVDCSDPGQDDITITFEWGDDTSSSEIVSAAECTGVSVTHSYEVAGVFSVGVFVTDDEGDSSDIEEHSVVVYDPSAGFATGGGWFMSPQGALVSEPTATGKATFGFVSKYKKGATVPTGNTQFQFKGAELSFHSSAYQYLVITGSNYAKVKGTGIVNGELDPNGEEFKFQFWAGDGTGPLGEDTFSIKIFYEDQTATEHLVYENTRDQPIDGGSIKIHDGK